MSPQTSACPCQTFVHPRPIFNSPQQNSILYRVGDFVSFREALLLAVPGEIELVNWRPGAQGDLAVQMVEWWAYLADILTFYNERIANQDYLLTANLPESVGGLIRILGYRPRPGIGATGTVAATMSGIKPFTLPQGYPIQSKATPGKQPQVFELGTATLVQPPDVIAADPATAGSLLGADGSSVLLQGVVTSTKIGDAVVLLPAGWTGVDGSGNRDLRYAVATVQTVAPEKDPRGKTNTRITLHAQTALPTTALAANYRLLRSAQSTVVWQYPAAHVLQPQQVDLSAITRSIHVGDPVLFLIPDASPKDQLVSVTSYAEAVWYANPPGTDPSQPPGSPPDISIPIPHTRLGFQPPLQGTSDSSAERAGTRVLSGWQDVGTLIATPATALTGTQLDLRTALPASLLPMTNEPVLVSDGNGNGVAAQASADSSNPSTVGLSNIIGSPTSLSAPFSVLFDLLQVSRGKSVSNEILGSGNATITAGQEFTLANSPLTYLPGGSSSSGTDYHSTLRVWVDGVQWQEVPSFYGQPQDARVFVTREDDQNVTHVQFGDGVNGARLSSGVNNVVASYRYGSGAQSPDAESLTVILQPWPGLKSILNPVAAGGGADPDPPQKIQSLAPQSVLTFGRAISADDYETIAAQAPGVSRARAYFTWDDVQQRNMVKVYVGDDDHAVANANLALAGADDPNRPLKVILAASMAITVSFTLVIDPTHIPASVTAAVTTAITDSDVGLLGANLVGIGQSIYQSQVFAACLAVPGVIAVHDLQIARKRQFLFFNVSRFFPEYQRIGRFRRIAIQAPPCSASCQCDFRFDPGEGNFFQLAPADLTINPEVNGNAG
jgi:hypothetical protein